VVLWAFAALALVAGALLFVGSEDTDDWFSWTIEPASTAAFLGAAYWAACVLLAWSASRASWEQVRPALVPVTLIAALLLVATLVHLDRFHRDLLGWFWVAAYVAVPPLLGAAVWRQLRTPPTAVAAGGAAMLPGALRVVLVAQGVVMLGIGVALFVAPTDVDALWPWKLTPLTARAVGAFLTGFGASALHAVIENRIERFEGAALAYTLLGGLELLGAALHAEDFDGDSLDTWAYVVFLASVVAAGLWGIAAARRGRA
jgi:hypothetical protein